MLVLKRREGEAIVINERIRVIVRNPTSGGCQLAIEAPDHDIIRREELPPNIEAVIQQTAATIGLPR